MQLRHNSATPFGVKLFDPTGDATPVLTLLEFFRTTYVQFHPALRESTRIDYELQIKGLDAWRQSPVRVSELCDDLIAAYLFSLLEAGRSPATVKKARATLLALWRFAWRKRHTDEQPRDLPPIAVPKPEPTAWSPEELDRLLAACRAYRTIGDQRQQWDADLWVALILVLYDTSLRIHALLATRVAQLDLARGQLRCAADAQKQNAETSQSLHPETLEAIRKTLAPQPSRELLFPWPYGERRIFYHLGKILRAAGLPATKRDKFHKIRRTSYTQVWARLGLDAATEHAGHSCDLSRHYLDKELSKKISRRRTPVDVLPRPGSAQQMTLF